MGGCSMAEVITRSHEWLDKLADYASLAFTALFMALIIITQY
tara:strand:- start:284 stop:409 length:126 start_codon:yes stop_codon:yes gene_type:complete